MRDQSSYYTSLVNGGIITINEAREQLGFEKIDGQDEVRVPANIAEAQQIQMKAEDRQRKKMTTKSKNKKSFSNKDG